MFPNFISSDFYFFIVLMHIDLTLSAACCFPSPPLQEDEINPGHYNHIPEVGTGYEKFGVPPMVG